MRNAQAIGGLLISIRGRRVNRSVSESDAPRQGANVENK